MIVGLRDSKEMYPSLKVRYERDASSVESNDLNILD